MPAVNALLEKNEKNFCIGTIILDIEEIVPLFFYSKYNKWRDKQYEYLRICTSVEH